MIANDAPCNAMPKYDAGARRSVAALRRSLEDTNGMRNPAQHRHTNMTAASTASAGFIGGCLQRRASLAAGANILNLTGTAGAKEIFRMVAAHDAAVIICYVAGKNVREVGDFDLSTDPVPRLRDFFARQIEIAQCHGVEKIFIDPGLGFYYRNLQDSAVRVRHQMNIFLNTFRLRELGFPICHALPHAFEFFREEVRCAEPFFAVLAALGKTDLFRTHEVPRLKAVLETMKVF